MASPCLLGKLSDPDRQRIGSRVMAVFAHPDDETIALGGQLDRLDEVTVVHVTNGSPLDPGDALASGFPTRATYAAARRREAEDALALAGIGAERLVGLGIDDQDAAHRMPVIGRMLAGIIRALRPSAIVSHAYEGGHPDHDATALAVRAAIRLAGRPVELIEAPLYHGGADDWVTQRFADAAPGTVEVPLRPPALLQKRRMLAAHASQATVLQRFTARTEWFRPAGPVDFAAPPASGRHLYDGFGWGFDGEAWMRLARAAIADFGGGYAGSAP